MQTRREMLRAVGLAAAGVGAAGLLGGSARPTRTEFGGLVRATTPRAPAQRSDRDAVVRALRAFSTDLFARLTSEPGNLACAPYSVAMALALTRNGARGTTADELDRVLHSTSLDRLNGGLNALQQYLAGRSGRFQRNSQTPFVDQILAVASSLWGQRSEPWQPTFLDALSRYYDAGMHTVDFVADPETARHDVNGWTSQHTYGRIPELLPRGCVDTTTRLVLVNALYLKAPWLTAFQEVRTAPFTRPDGSRVDVPMMGGVSLRTTYTTGPGWQAVRVPYISGELAMTVLVPDPGRFDEVQRALSGPLLGQLLESDDAAEVLLRMPRWTFRTHVDLSDALKALGMPTAFTDRADFTGMTTADPLQITSVQHEAYIAVDEQGTEAAAATGVVVGLSSGLTRYAELTVDRPFLFVIHDTETGTPLFLGRVTDPTAG